MKKTLLAFATLALLSSGAFASELVKSCEILLPSLDDESIDIKQEFKIFKDKDFYSAELVETAQGQTSTTVYTAEYKNYDIREGLKADISDEVLETLNPGEVIIVHAMATQDDDVLGDIFDSGIKDLSQVRKVNTYLVGERTDMGSATIVEAFDKDGKNLGSFLGGFLVAPCK